MLILASPGCLLFLLLVIALLLIAAALLNRSQNKAVEPAPLPVEPPRQTIPVQRHEIIASAAYEALAASRERLHEFLRRLPPDSDDARWLNGYLNDLRNVMDDVYWELDAAQRGDLGRLLNVLGAEVARLNQEIMGLWEAQFIDTATRAALEMQLDEVRRSVRDNP